ncbi:hypothetical protein FRC12_000667 [Ceratobasidium sp. 428]|nr:hypothetical protein FRC12_000667 [Ceratobasidium sp. 428]
MPSTWQRSLTLPLYLRVLYSFNVTLSPISCSHPSQSNEEVHCPRPADPIADAEKFGRLLGENRLNVPKREMRMGQEDKEDKENEGEEEDGGGGDGGNGGKPDWGGENKNGPPMFVPPAEFRARPEAPDGDDEGEVFAQHQVLYNI